MLKRIAFGALGFFLLASPVFAQTTDVQSQIAALLALVQQLQAQLAQLQQAKTGTGSTCASLSHDLWLGQKDASTDGDVSRLQTFLGGEATGYFGPATLKLVQNWQSSHGIASSGTAETTGYGYIGAKTRAAMRCAIITPAIPSNHQSMFPSPYPVVWQGGSETYSLVGAYIGYASVPPDAQIPNNPTNRNIKDSQGNPYPVGSKVYVVKLYVKGNPPPLSGYNDSYDTYSDITRIVNSDGDEVKSNIEGIASTLGPSQIINGFKVPEVWFIIPAGQTQFTFSSGARSSPSNISFGVMGNSDGTITAVSYSKNSLLSNSSTTTQARDAQRVSDIKQIQLAAELYFDANNERYPSSLAPLAADFISAIPVDPLTNQAYSYAALGTSCSGYHLGARLENASSPALASDGDFAPASALCPGSASDFSGADPIYDTGETVQSTYNIPDVTPPISSLPPVITSIGTTIPGVFQIPEGQTASVYGSHLGYVDTVFFNGTKSMSPTSVNDSQVDIIVPSSMTAPGWTYNLYVSGPNGTSNTVPVKVLSETWDTPGLYVTVGDQPADGTAGKGASLRFTRFTLTNTSYDVVVFNAVVAQRTGPASDAVFRSVSLRDERGNVVANGTIDSNHQIGLRTNIQINPRSSRTFELTGEMASSFSANDAGQAASLTLTGVSTVGTPSFFDEVLPLKGAMYTIGN